MGKHERQLIEEAEKIIVKILISQGLSDSDKLNRWFKHAGAVAKQIKDTFPNIVSVEHLGNRYDNTGDILITTPDSKKFFIEVKMSDTKASVGTKANISQDALTENNLFSNRVKSWSQFRQEKNHDSWVNSYLNLFTKYPKQLFEIKNPTIQKEGKARYLRELAKRDKKARNILGTIQERDRKEKIEYLTYLNSQNQQEEIIKRFFILITLGIHQKGELKNLINKANFFQEIQNLLVFYANLDKDQIIVKKEDLGEKIKQILKNYSGFKIIFSTGITYCKLVGRKKNAYKPLLQIVLHWKNIAQGIKTPCLNIFDLTTKHP